MFGHHPWATMIGLVILNPDDDCLVIFGYEGWLSNIILVPRWSTLSFLAPIVNIFIFSPSGWPWNSSNHKTTRFEGRRDLTGG